MFQIKICGITSVGDALAVARAGADAIGLNFYPKSPRYISPDTARQIIAALPNSPLKMGATAGLSSSVVENARKNTAGQASSGTPDLETPHFQQAAKRIVKVGLFVNAPPAEVCQLYDDLQLDLIQLHGDEPPEYLVELGPRPVMRAFRVGPAGLRPTIEYLARCRELGALPKLTLLDALVVGEYGGTGETADWPAAREYVAQADLPPLVLAGGLVPENVAEAIAAVQPAAVDVASGVESSPGRKDAVAVEAFVQAAGKAFGSTDSERSKS